MDLPIERANQVWATDICYIPMAKGFIDLVVIMDWHSRRVLSWRVSNTLDTDFCIEALQEALQRFGAPAIFNRPRCPVHLRGVHWHAQKPWHRQRHCPVLGVHFSRSKERLEPICRLCYE